MSGNLRGIVGQRGGFRTHQLTHLNIWLFDGARQPSASAEVEFIAAHQR